MIITNLNVFDWNWIKFSLWINNYNVRVPILLNWLCHINVDVRRRAKIPPHSKKNVKELKTKTNSKKKKRKRNNKGIKSVIKQQD